MSKKACPRIRFVRENMAGHVAITAFHGSRKVGLVTIRNKISIGFIDVHPSMQRCGLGTRLYEKAAKIACEEAGVPLRSDIERTAASQGFWDKQVSKGRAECVEYTGPETGPAHESIMGRGGCYFFQLTCPAPKSLAGRRRR